MHPLLSRIDSALVLHDLTVRELRQLADEVREVLCNLVTDRSAHFASNLGVVELCLALHSVFDFRRDRLLWDTGHQIYPHKMVTGRYRQIASLRTRGVLGVELRLAEPPADEDWLRQATAALRAAPGPAPVFVEWLKSPGNGSVETSACARLRSRAITVAPDEALLRQLRALLGEDQVRLVRS